MGMNAIVLFHEQRLDKQVDVATTSCAVCSSPPSPLARYYIRLCNLTCCEHHDTVSTVCGSTATGVSVIEANSRLLCLSPCTATPKLARMPCPDGAERPLQESISVPRPVGIQTVLRRRMKGQRPGSDCGIKSTNDVRPP